MGRRRVGGIAALLALVILLGFGVSKLMNSRTFQVAGELTSRVDTPERVVALTFDDGPTREDTQEILDALAAEDVRATFFVVGSEANSAPKSVASLAAGGHQLANHSWSHPRMVLLGQEAIASRSKTLIGPSGRRVIPGPSISARRMERSCCSCLAT